MTERENQLRLDDLSQLYLAAVDDDDQAALAVLRRQAETDDDLAVMLHYLDKELAAEQDGGA